MRGLRCGAALLLPPALVWGESRLQGRGQGQALLCRGRHPTARKVDSELPKVDSKLRKVHSKLRTVDSKLRKVDSKLWKVDSKNVIYCHIHRSGHRYHDHGNDQVHYMVMVGMHFIVMLISKVVVIIMATFLNMIQ